MNLCRQRRDNIEEISLEDGPSVLDRDPLTLEERPAHMQRPHRVAVYLLAESLSLAEQRLDSAQLSLPDARAEPLLYEHREPVQLSGVVHHTRCQRYHSR